MYSKTLASNMKAYFLSPLRTETQQVGSVFISLMWACKREQAHSVTPQH